MTQDQKPDFKAKAIAVIKRVTFEFDDIENIDTNLEIEIEKALTEAHDLGVERAAKELDEVPWLLPADPEEEKIIDGWARPVLEQGKALILGLKLGKGE